jgi:hypothetical protein
MPKSSGNSRRQATTKSRSTGRDLDATERATREVFPEDVLRNLTDSRRMAEQSHRQVERSGDRYLVHLGR